MPSIKVWDSAGNRINLTEDQRRDLLKESLGVDDVELAEMERIENGGHGDVVTIDEDGNEVDEDDEDENKSKQMSVIHDVSDEKRDKSGKWINGGGSGESSLHGESRLKHPVEMKINSSGYPLIEYHGETLESQFTEEEQELISDQFSEDLDELVSGLALGNHTESELSDLPDEIQDKLKNAASELKESLEEVPSGKPFRETDSDTYFRIHKGPMKPEDLHENHISKLWQDDGEMKSTRQGLSVAGSVNDLVDYFTGAKENSLGRGATLDGSYIVELRGNPSDDTPYEEAYGEQLIHPHEIVKQSPIDETDFISKVVKNVRKKRQGDSGGIIGYDPENDKICRIVMENGKIKHLDF